MFVPDWLLGYLVVQKLGAPAQGTPSNEIGLQKPIIHLLTNIPTPGTYPNAPTLVFPTWSGYTKLQCNPAVAQWRGQDLQEYSPGTALVWSLPDDNSATVITGAAWMNSTSPTFALGWEIFDTPVNLVFKDDSIVLLPEWNAGPNGLNLEIRIIK
jgi:hypothetical protein